MISVWFNSRHTALKSCIHAARRRQSKALSRQVEADEGIAEKHGGKFVLLMFLQVLLNEVGICFDMLWKNFWVSRPRLYMFDRRDSTE